MIKWSIKISNEDGFADLTEKWGLIPLSIDHRMSAPIKARDKSAYAEQRGVNIDTRAVYDTFEVTAKVCAIAKNVQHVNCLISAFNEAIFIKRDDSDIVDVQKVVLLDHDKHRALVGYPKQPLGTEPEEWFRVGDEEVAVMDLVIEVADPNECDFDYHEGVGYWVIGSTFKIR